MGVVFFVINAAFALVLLILVLISSIYAIASKNPDVRYERMQDDRASFIKSQTHLPIPTELNALGVTARGEGKDPRGLDGMDTPSSGVTQPEQTVGATRPHTNRDPPHSPAEQFSFGDAPIRRGQSPILGDNPRDPYQGSDRALLGPGLRSNTGSPSPFGRSGGTHPYKQSNYSSQWQVGAGYDH
jgi:Transient receptor potential (TRP) ion channel